MEAITQKWSFLPVDNIKITLMWISHGGSHMSTSNFPMTVKSNSLISAHIHCAGSCSVSFGLATCVSSRSCLISFTNLFNQKFFNEDNLPLPRSHNARICKYPYDDKYQDTSNFQAKDRCAALTSFWSAPFRTAGSFFEWNYIFPEFHVRSNQSFSSLSIWTNQESL